MTPALPQASPGFNFLPSEGAWTFDDAVDAITTEFALPLGGVPIKYALPIPGKSGSWRTNLTGTLQSALKKPDKASLPCLELWSAFLKLVVADFDTLPGDFEDWEGFRGYLSWRYERDPKTGKPIRPGTGEVRPSSCITLRASFFYAPAMAAFRKERLSFGSDSFCKTENNF